MIIIFHIHSLIHFSASYIFTSYINLMLNGLHIRDYTGELHVQCTLQVKSFQFVPTVCSYMLNTQMEYYVPVVLLPWLMPRLDAA